PEEIGGRMAPDFEAGRQMYRRLFQAITQKIFDLSKPVIAMVNGPASIIVANGSGLTGVAGKNTMVGLTDRIKLRPLVCAQKDDYTFMASEESAIKAVCKNPDFVWAPRAGKPTVALVNADV
ncbi:MAG: hypothetical protein MUO70_04245, partial [Euryarchaeota archaeon]|nr:hypothetical protein [Euryarchaeota archaeon]